MPISTLSKVENKEYIMSSQQFYWAGTYSFKNEVRFFLELLKKQIDLLLSKIEKTEKFIER